MALKDRALIKFPALVQAATGLAVSIANGVYVFTLDWLSVDLVDSVVDPTTNYLLIVDEDGVYQRIALDDFVQSTAGNVQEITAGGPQNIEETASLVKVNQTVGAPITLTLPASAGKVGQVKVVDWKGDAATNNITIVLTGAETFQGGLTSWLINGDSGSNAFTPIPGDGYAV